MPDNFVIPPEFLNGVRRRKRSVDDEKVASSRTGTKESASSKKDTHSERVLPPVSKELTKIVNKIFGEIDDLRFELKEVKQPKGTQENPARTCRDIYLVYPDLQDGKLFVCVCVCVCVHTEGRGSFDRCPSKHLFYFRLVLD